MSFHLIPNEIVIQIFYLKTLTQEDLLSLRRVCVRFHDLIDFFFENLDQIFEKYRKCFATPQREGEYVTKTRLIQTKQERRLYLQNTLRISDPTNLPPNGISIRYLEQSSIDKLTNLDRYSLQNYFSFYALSYCRYFSKLFIIPNIISENSLDGHYYSIKNAFVWDKTLFGVNVVFGKVEMKLNIYKLFEELPKNNTIAEFNLSPFDQHFDFKTRVVNRFPAEKPELIHLGTAIDFSIYTVPFSYSIQRNEKIYYYKLLAIIHKDGEPIRYSDITGVESVFTRTFFRSHFNVGSRKILSVNFQSENNVFIGEMIVYLSEIDGKLTALPDDTFRRYFYNKEKRYF
jgi:hypothetical protein